MAETMAANGDKRERILATAAELFSRRDFGCVLMDDVAAAAQVAKGTIYNYFGSKDALYREVVTSRLEHLVGVLCQSCRERDDVRLNVRRIAVHVMSFMLKYPDFFRIWKREEGWVCGDEAHPWYALRGQLHAILIDQIARGIAHGLIRPLEPARAAACIFGAIDGAVYHNLRWSDAEREVCAQREVRAQRDLLDDFVWRGLSAVAHPPATFVSQEGVP